VAGFSERSGRVISTCESGFREEDLGSSESLEDVHGDLAERIAGVKSDPNLGMTGTMLVNRLDAGGSPVFRSPPGTAPQSPDDRLRQPFAKCDGCGS
jgi:hypothetical protein